MAMFFRKLGGGEVPPAGPTGPAIAHFGPEAREIQARENMARELAGRLLAAWRRGDFARVHVLLGRGPTGALGAALGRHLWNMSVPFGLALVGAPERATGETERELASLAAFGLRPEPILSEDHGLDLLESLAPDVKIVSCIAPGELEGRARAIAQAVCRSPRMDAAEAPEFDVAHTTSPPCDDVAEFRPEHCPRTREDSRLLDSVGMESYGLLGLGLMENAGAAAAAECWRMVQSAESDGPVVIVAGRGNNGGDGHVIARHLAWWGVESRVFLLGAEGDVFGDALVNLEALDTVDRAATAIGTDEEIASIGPACEGAPVVVDAILGTGLTGEVRGRSRKAVEALSGCEAPLLAIDTPSGLDCNTGHPLGICLKADRTVTFAASKVGFGQPGAEEFTGTVMVADIGLPPAAYGEGK